MSKMGNEFIRQQETGDGCPICGQPTLPAGKICSLCITKEEYYRQIKRRSRCGSQ